ncbi:NAD(P)H-dependent oxidoreductase [Bacillus cereus]|uniref:Flavodoxin-like fold domain-containing protein n=1 Tax=Bacillus cereus VD184 TaxID=1053242 RepID=A0A9W5R0W4_BACCE|nr:NAD(P)H-dependent oxidoreductase [Bacillus cereus]EOQ01472.1 hypothetical protein IKC_06249 [Bacillus cereus VD184]
MKILVVLAHPDLAQSHVNRTLVEELKKNAEIDIHDLYSSYPDWKICVKKEQVLLEKYNRIILQFPFYWYSMPALMKKWLEEILTPGWAYGEKGNKLAEKEFILAITTGGSAEGYQAGGYNWHTISEYTRPLQATIIRCGGIFLPSFVTYNTKKLTGEELKLRAQQYVGYIKKCEYIPFGH